MKLEQVEKLLALHEAGGGNVAAMFEYLKDRLISTHTEEELFGANQFLFFEDRYLLGMKHMFENQIHGDILDIGIQYGFQSEIFLDEKSYTGIEMYPHRFFNAEKPNVTYLVGSFPNEIHVKLADYDAVFSIMSLGYFNKHIDTNMERVYDFLEETLVSCRHLYIATDEVLTERLKKRFEIQTLLSSNVHEGGRFMKPARFDFYYFSQGK